MPANQKKKFKPPSLEEFRQQFATEDDCARFLFEKRWPKGWKCPKCNHAKCYLIKGRKLYECAACGHQVSVTAGTVMHKTRTPLRIWFEMIYLVAVDKRGVSSVGLGNILGITQKKAWCMLQKLRHAMGERDGRYMLDGVVEIGESFFGNPKEGGDRHPAKAAKINMLAGLSVTSEGNPRYIKIKVVPGFSREHLEPAVEAMVAAGSKVKTNGLRSYLSLGAKGFSHERAVAGDTEEPEEPGWLQTAVTNFMALVGGTYHGLENKRGKHSQAYLDEFAYRFNRRNRPDLIAERCIAALAACPPWTYRDIVSVKPVCKKAQP